MLEFTLDTLQVQRVYLNPGTTNSFGSNFAESEQCDNTKELKIKKSELVLVMVRALVVVFVSVKFHFSIKPKFNNIEMSCAFVNQDKYYNCFKI